VGPAVAAPTAGGHAPSFRFGRRVAFG